MSKRVVQRGTVLKVADNSGAELVRCIGFVGKHMCAGVGDVITISAIKVKSSAALVKKKAVMKALIVRANGVCFHRIGFGVNFMENAVVLLNDKNELIGTRVFGNVTSLESIRANFPKAISLAQGVY